MTAFKWTAPVLGLVLFAGVPAKADDVSYCKALAASYERYVVKIDYGHTVQRGPTDASLALEQCRKGNVAGIPVLERELRKAKVDLPARG
jgi:hypothetical protein